MSDLRKAAEMALETLEEINKLSIGEKAICLPAEIDDAMEALRQALAEPEDPRIVELRTLMAEPTVTGVIFEVHRGPLSKSIREYGECLCPTHVEGDVRIEVKDDKPWVKSYCGGVPNYCTPEETPEVTPEVTGDVAAVNMTQERVDETAKGEQEPFIYIREDTEMPFGGYEHCGQYDAGAFPVYLAPPKKEWVGLTDEEIEDAMDYWSDDEHSDFGGAYQADGEYFNVRASWRYIEAKLKEKNT